MTEGNTQREKHCQNIKSSPGGGKYSSFSLYSGLVLCKSAPWLESGPHRCSSRWQFSGIYRRMKDLITVKAIKIIQWKASPRFGRPIRMSPEPEDDVNRCLLKDERVERGATKEGLHLETLQVTKPVRWIFAQKLHRQIWHMRGITGFKTERGESYLQTSVSSKIRAELKVLGRR